MLEKSQWQFMFYIYRYTKKVRQSFELSACLGGTQGGMAEEKEKSADKSNISNKV